MVCSQKWNLNVTVNSKAVVFGFQHCASKMWGIIVLLEVEFFFFQISLVLSVTMSQELTLQLSTGAQ
jgi:hypothetical protein